MYYFILIFSLITFSAYAGKNLKGNGFPSGEHFNLNLLGKKEGFKCPEAEFDEYGNQVYGNVIFFPREKDNKPITVLMESGKKGPKNAPNTSSLEVTDWCTESFSQNGASLRLPQNDKGYRVYARITGKPSGDTSLSLSSELAYVEDESGNDLLYLGLVDSQGVFSSTGEELIRDDSTKKGKGVQKATDLTGLFEYSGNACYLQEDSDLYCIDEQNQNTCSALDLCCIDRELDGIYDRCDALSGVGVDLNLDGVLECPVADQDGHTYFSEQAQCKTYDNEWVFNIGDFVGLLWNIDNNGSYNVQIRFYPNK